MQSLNQYGHHNFAVAILKVVFAPVVEVSYGDVLEEEQGFLNQVFGRFPAALRLNVSRVAGRPADNPAGTYSHTAEWKASRRGAGNPMYGRPLSPEFLAQQRSEAHVGPLNNQYGVIKTPETVAKLTNIVVVRDAFTGEILSETGTVATKLQHRIGYDTMMSCIKSGAAHKGKVYALKKLKLKDDRS